LVISNVVSLGPSSDRPQFRNSTAANEPIRHQRLRGFHGRLEPQDAGELRSQQREEAERLQRFE
jgi:hypothetical protein